MKFTVARAGTYEENEEQHVLDLPFGMIRFDEVTAYVIDQGRRAPPYATLQFGHFPNAFYVTDETLIKQLIRAFIIEEIYISFNENEIYFKDFAVFNELRIDNPDMIYQRELSILEGSGANFARDGKRIGIRSLPPNVKRNMSERIHAGELFATSRCKYGQDDSTYSFVKRRGY